MNQLKIHEVEDGLVGHLKAALPAMDRQIASLTNGDFNAGGDVIVTDLPAIRVFYRTGPLARGAGRMNDSTALTYDAALGFVVLCGASNMRSRAEERKDALELVDDVLDALAGKRLEGLPSYQMSRGPQVVLQNAGELFQFGPDGTWYAVPVVVEGITQYERNAAAA